MNPYRQFWDVPVDQVPDKTGAATVMDCSDIQDVLNQLGVDTHGRVVDVGCGTGRMADLSGSWVGFDVAPAMVEYARQHGRDARLTTGPDDLASAGSADLVLCLSVFTHLPRTERQAYLARFSEIAPTVLVDILDGEEGGSIAVWFADRDCFEADLAAAGFTEFDSYKRGSPDGAGHLYYHAWKP